MKKIRIGKRNIKTAISVFIATSLYVIFMMIDKIYGNEVDGFTGLTGYYTPFFAGIAAAYASHNDRKQSWKMAKIRSIGSFIGGYFGALVILLIEFLFIFLFPINNEIIYQLVALAMVSGAVVILIYLTVVAKQTDTTFITCLTYLSVTISIRNGGMNILQFATNRVLSTIIGVGIALVVNVFTIYYKRNKQMLFVADLDDADTTDDYQLKYTVYKINDLYNKDIKLALHTSNHLVNEKIYKNYINYKPLVLMDGVCIYDFKTKEYIYSCDFVDNVKQELNKILKDYETFTYIIHDLKLCCYYKNVISNATKNFYDLEKNDYRCQFVYADVLPSCDVAMYKIIYDNPEVILNKINELGFAKDLIINVTDFSDSKLITILPKNSRRVDTIRQLPYYDKNDFVVAFMNSEVDLQLLEIADFKICFENSPKEIKDICDFTVKSNNFNDVLRLFGRIYTSYNYEKKLKRLRSRK